MMIDTIIKDWEKDTVDIISECLKVYEASLRSQCDIARVSIDSDGALTLSTLNAGPIVTLQDSFSMYLWLLSATLTTKEKLTLLGEADEYLCHAKQEYLVDLISTKYFNEIRAFVCEIRKGIILPEDYEEREDYTPRQPEAPETPDNFEYDEAPF